LRAALSQPLAQEPPSSATLLLVSPRPANFRWRIVARVVAATINLRYRLEPSAEI
jgi:hypothetical protein